MKQRPKFKTDPSGYNPLGYNKYSDSSDEEIDSIELPLKKFQRQQQYIEAEVQDGDTLQAIAIRFNCSVAKLMRVNNILRENEIFAKKVLRIPVSAYSLLTESIPMVHTSGTNSPTKQKLKENPPIPPVVNSEEFQEKLIVATVNSSQTKPNIPMPDDVTVNSELLLRDSAEPDAPLLPNGPSRKSGAEAIFISEIISKGDNFGLRLCPLVIIIIVVGFVIPFLYIEYVKEHPEKFHHHMENKLP